MRDLILRAKRGDRQATADLAGRLRGRVRGIALYYATRSPQDVDDIEQEVWLGILTAVREVDVSIGDPVQFLLKRGRWKALDSIKRSFRRREDAVEDMSMVRDHQQFEDGVLTACLVEELKQRLSDRQATIVDYLVAGRSGEEVAQILGCSPANVTYHVKRIRQEFTTLMNAA